MRSQKHIAFLFLLLALLLACFSALAADITLYASDYPVKASGSYSTMEEVAVYLATYDKLPGNYITKQKAQSLGWDSRLGNLWDVSKGSSIGGDRFGNYEGLLPDAKGRKWTECDIDYQGGYRGPKRICFSNDGLIYYSPSHYNHFQEIEVIFASAKETATPKVTATPVPSFLSVSVPVEYGACYTDWDAVASYLFAYEELPVNYISLEDAKDLGFSSKKDNMGEVAPEFAIGGGVFQNREKLLPEKKGRVWYECDVDIKNGKRGKHRLLFSNDGLIYLTRDKYKSFTEVREAQP